MLKVTVRNNIKFPEIHLEKDLEDIADRIIIPRIIRGIQQSVSIDGGNFPPNSEATLKRKAKLGQGTKPLIAKGDLLSSFYHEVIGKNKVLISILEWNRRKEIGGYLQYPDNVSRPQFSFFGISKEAKESALQYMRDRIDEDINHVRNR